MLTRDEIEAKLKNNPDWEPDSASPNEVWDLYYEVLDSSDFDEDEDEDVKDELEESEEDDEEGDEDIEGDWDESAF